MQRALGSKASEGRPLPVLSTPEGLDTVSTCSLVGKIPKVYLTPRLLVSRVVHLLLVIDSSHAVADSRSTARFCSKWAGYWKSFIKITVEVANEAT